jgi:hypothetical protein
MPISSQWLRKPFSSQEWRNVVRLRKRRECLAATHVTGELVGSFFDRTRLPLRAVPLGFDPSSVTAIANDFSYQIIFPRQLQALGKPGDILWAFSTSGNSPNVLAAMETAKNIGITTVLFSNHDGGRAVLWPITFCIRRSHLLPGYRNCTCFIPTFSAKSLSCIAPETRVEL